MSDLNFIEAMILLFALAGVFVVLPWALIGWIFDRHAERLTDRIMERLE